MAEWLRSGLQSRLHRFDSGRRLSFPANARLLFSQLLVQRRRPPKRGPSDRFACTYSRPPPGHVPRSPRIWPPRWRRPKAPRGPSVPVRNRRLFLSKSIELHAMLRESGSGRSAVRKVAPAGGGFTRRMMYAQNNTATFGKCVNRSLSVANPCGAICDHAPDLLPCLLHSAQRQHLFMRAPRLDGRGGPPAGVLRGPS